MAPPSKKILVFGGTGLIGKFLVDALVEAKGSFERIGIFTSAATVDSKKELIDSYKSQGVEVITGDVGSESDVLEAYKGAFPS